MGQIVVIDAEQNNKTALSKLLSPQDIMFISSQESLGELSDDIEIIIIDSPQGAFSYLMEIRQKNILLPIILLIYPEYEQKKIISLAELYQCVCLNVGELSKLPALRKEFSLRAEENELLLKPHLLGNAPLLLKIRKDLRSLSRLNVDVFLYSESGCGKKNIALWLHNSFLASGEFMELNLNNYYGDDYEVRVWAALKDIYAIPIDEEFAPPRSFYRTLYIKGLEHKDILFVVSLLEWIYQKRKNAVFPLRVIVALEDKAMLQTLSADFLEKYFLLEVASLRERREDITEIIKYYLEEFNFKYQQNISFLETELFEFCAWYEWPGNIEELRYNLEAVFLAAAANKKEISLRDLLINEEQLFAYCLQSAGVNNYPEALKKLKKIGNK